MIKRWIKLLNRLIYSVYHSDMLTKQMRKASLLGRFTAWRVKKKMSSRSLLLILSALVGIAAGFTALTLKSVVLFLRQLFTNDVQFGLKNYLYLIYPVIGIILTVFMTRYLFNPNIRHSITSILYSISKKNSVLHKHKIFTSWIGGILTAGFGGSVGLESPIISAGATLGSNLGRTMHMNYKAVTLLLACGASGAIAAIFNTPIAAIVFALEVLLLDLTRFSLIPLLVASSCGALTTKILFDEEILFGFRIIDEFYSQDIPFFIIFGAFSGFVSYYFTRIYTFTESRFSKMSKSRHRILYGGIIMGTLLFFFPPLFGEGFFTIKAMLAGDVSAVLGNTLFSSMQDSSWFVLLFFVFLALLKVVATSVTISAGGIGGIFAPSLFTGAISGYLFASSFNLLGFEMQLSVINFSLVGMASVLAGVLHAPLTGIFLIAEITSGYELMVPLMIAATMSFICAKYFEPNSIFTKQLANKGQLITHHKDKAVLTFMRLKSVIETDLLSIRVDGTLRDLVKIVAKSHRNLYPVLDANHVLVGIVLLDDIREIMFNEKMYDSTNISNLMQLPPELITMEDTMDEVMAKFNDSNAWNLPVIDNGKYVGFVSKSKMFSVYRKLLVEISDD